MATQFPKAVIVDRFAEHHCTVSVWYETSEIRYVCSCGVDAYLPLDDLELLRQQIRDSHKTQVLAWVEYPHE